MTRRREKGEKNGKFQKKCEKIFHFSQKIKKNSMYNIDKRVKKSYNNNDEKDLDEKLIFYNRSFQAKSK